MPPPKKFHPDREFFEVLYLDEGMTVAELAELCDAGQTTIRDWMDDYGIPRRQGRPQAQEQV
jgi:transposase-like protein